MNWIAIIDHLPALPEAILLLGACALMIVDLYVKDAGRRATLWLAQIVLALCLCATLFVLWGSGGRRLLIFSGLFVSDSMGHLLKMVCYLAVSVALGEPAEFTLATKASAPPLWMRSGPTVSGRIAARALHNPTRTLWNMRASSWN